ncbi:MAG: hypothetical protein GY774_32170 [Planctomycetes bacterium]|nr:hypothetical protein [Planctomycetota bacterium]
MALEVIMDYGCSSSLRWPRLTEANRCGSGARLEANGVCRKPSLLHPLVVRRKAPSSLRMVIRSDCRGRKASSTTTCITSGPPKLTASAPPGFLPSGECFC